MDNRRHAGSNFSAATSYIWNFTGVGYCSRAQNTGFDVRLSPFAYSLSRYDDNPSYNYPVGLQQALANVALLVLKLSFLFISICLIILWSLTISAQGTSYKSGELLVKELSNGKKTYILKNGKYPFTGSWETATEFSNGHALVADHQIYYGIDTTGKILFTKNITIKYKIKIYILQ